jgi:hypothetical protein
MFKGLAAKDEDPRKSLHLEHVPTQSQPQEKRWWT